MLTINNTDHYYNTEQLMLSVIIMSVKSVLIINFSIVLIVTEDVEMDLVTVVVQ